MSEARSRLAVVGVVLGLAALGAVSALWLFGAPLVEAGRDKLEPYGRLDAQVTRPRSAAPLVVLAGDSTFDRRPRRSYPHMLGERLGDRAELRALWAVGIGPVEHYLLLSKVLALEPELVLLLAHLRMFWSEVPLWHPSLLTLLPPTELPRAVALPFQTRGVGAGRVVAASGLGALGRPEWMYAYAGGILLARRTPGLRWLSPMGAPRAERVEVERERVRQAGGGRYGERLYRGHPALRMLGAAVEMAARRGARVLVLVNPIPIQRLVEAGSYADAAIESRIALVREVAERNGAELLDLHDLLPRAGFRDGLGHYTESGARRVADVLLPVLRSRLDIASGTGTGPG